MIKVFEDFNFSRVGQAQSLLEAAGIATFMRNQFGSSVMGDIPFVEVVPQLYILDADQLDLAEELLRDFQPLPPASELSTGWHCPACETTVDGPFGACWNCGQLRPA